MIFYHGTTSALGIKDYIVPPSESGVLREPWRKKFLNCVFFTPSLLSAEGYAKKAVKKYGGTPVIYIVKPIGLVGNPVNNEYVADSAKVVRKL